MRRGAFAAGAQLGMHTARTFTLYADDGRVARVVIDGDAVLTDIDWGKRRRELWDAVLPSAAAAQEILSSTLQRMRAGGFWTPPEAGTLHFARAAVERLARVLQASKEPHGELILGQRAGKPPDGLVERIRAGGRAGQLDLLAGQVSRVGAAVWFSWTGSADHSDARTVEALHRGGPPGPIFFKATSQPARALAFLERHHCLDVVSHVVAFGRITDDGPIPPGLLALMGDDYAVRPWIGDPRIRAVEAVTLLATPDALLIPTLDLLAGWGQLRHLGLWNRTWTPSTLGLVLSHPVVTRLDTLDLFGADAASFPYDAAGEQASNLGTLRRFVLPGPGELSARAALLGVGGAQFASRDRLELLDYDLVHIGWPPSGLPDVATRP